MNNESSTDAWQGCPHELVQHFKEVYPVEQWKNEGFFVDSDLLDIDCHWMAFEPARPSTHFILTIAYVVVFLLGFFSNTFSIYIIASSKKMLSPANILLVNLGISDLLTVLMIPISIFNSFHQGPAIGKLGCFAYGFLTGLSGTCSIMSLTAVAVERYLVISQPFNLSGKPTRRWAYLVSLLTWLYSALFASLPLFGVGKYVPEGYLTGCSFDYLSNDMASRIFILVFVIGAWMVPMSIIVYSYVFIIRTVVQVRRDVAQIADSNINEAVGIQYNSANNTTTAYGNIRQPVNQLDIELKIAKILVGLIGAWMVTWTPYAIVALIGISGHGHLLTPLGSMFPALFAKLATCMDPLIYSLNQPKVRNEIMRRLHLIPPTVMNSSTRYHYCVVPGGPRRSATTTPPNNNVIVSSGRNEQQVVPSSPAPDDEIIRIANDFRLSNNLEGIVVGREEHCCIHHSSPSSNNDRMDDILYSSVLMLTIYSEGEVRCYYETMV